MSGPNPPGGFEMYKLSSVEKEGRLETEGVEGGADSGEYSSIYQQIYKDGGERAKIFRVRGFPLSH